MAPLLTLLSWIALSSGSALAAFNPYPPDSQNLDASSDLNRLGNNSLYSRWRPTYHFLAPGGHINDPCGPMYDPRTDTYHLFYQSFPQHTGFGNTSWSYAQSKDGMVTWKDVNDWRNRSMVAIATSPYYASDWIGAFSGGAQPVNLHGKADGNLTLMYTGASRFPDNWQLPYGKRTEQQNIATSSDGGRSWQKYEGNPVIRDVPKGWNVTGFRDPIFAPMPELDKILGYKEPHYYLVIGSGIRGVGPRIPLYSAKASDLTNWKFLGALFEVGQNVSFGGDATITGNFAYNFELASVYSLTEEKKNGGDGKSQHFLLNAGSEGYADRVHPLAHWSIYALGSVKKRANESVEMTIDAAGVLDWGNLYALNTFDDSKNKRRVIWGWSDEDINNYARVPIGYQGSMGLPREAFILKSHGVVVPRGGIKEGTGIWKEEKSAPSYNGGGRKTYSVTTLAHRPLPDVVAALQGRKQAIGNQKVNNGVSKLPIKGDRLHLHAKVLKAPDRGYVGMRIRASPRDEEYTQFNFYPHNASVVLDRSHSSLIKQFVKTTYVGHFAPYTFANGSKEALSIDVFVDGSLVEIFMNNRFALTSRVYPSRADALGAALVAKDCSVEFTEVQAWTTFKNTWPDRPRNASSPLEFDPYYETHVTFPNPYVAEGTQLYDGY